MNVSMFKSSGFTTSLTAIAAACLMAGCGGDDGVASNGGNGDGGNGAPQATVIAGVVSGSAVQSGKTTGPAILAAHFAGAMVCGDANDSGTCDAGEASAVTDSTGAFKLTMTTDSAIIADIGTSATNTGSGSKVASRLALRISKEQVAEQSAGSVVISPLSSEVLRVMEANNASYQSAKATLASRIGTYDSDAAQSVLADFAADGAKPADELLYEVNELGNRYTYATYKLDKKSKYPDALAVPGGDPELAGLANVSTATITGPQDTRKPITFAQAQQAAFNIEGIPRYDSIFIVMLENKGTSRIKDSPFAPNINRYLQSGNQLTSYFATGNPSEPNYTALGGGDDFGIADDSQWNCDAVGDNAPKDLPLPDNTQPGLGSSPFGASCTQGRANHNVQGENLFTLLSKSGLKWRTYNESMNPGQDPRTDSVADAAVVAKDYVYAAGVLPGSTAQVGSATLDLPMPSGLYKTKHHPGMAYQTARSLPEFMYSNRTMGGGQWDAAMKDSSAYQVPAGYDYDQLGTDLASGDVGDINFVIPDQCDDMHSITVKGTDSATGKSGTASDCGGDNILFRGDKYVDYLVKKIQASRLWANPNKRVAIVLMFDEGTATSGFNSCCGWNPGNSTVSQPLVVDENGKPMVDPKADTHYSSGNRGHGESVFGILTNQPKAAKGIVDSDAYSHFSLVRTMQDMFGIGKPEVDATYLNRAKYTEKFIARNLLTMPEFQNTLDTHFNGVRPINHAFKAPDSYTQKQSSDVKIPKQAGPDASQANVWAVDTL